MENTKPLYFGKAKSIYTTDDADFLRMHFRDDATAFDGEKKDSNRRRYGHFGTSPIC